MNGTRNIIAFTLCLFFAFQSIALNSTGESYIPYEKASGLIFVPAVIDNIEGKFIFDTAADQLLINEQHNTGDTNSEFKSIYGVVNAKKHTINKLKIGNYTVKNLNAYTVDLEQLEKHVGFEILGILGAQVLEADLIRIDAYNRHIEFYPREKLVDRINLRTRKIPIEFENGLPILKVQAGSSQMNFVLDTGSSISMIRKELVESLPQNLIKTRRQVDIITAAGQSDPSYYYESYGLSIGPHLINNMKLAATDMHSIQDAFEIRIDGVLSLDDLPFNSFVLDFKHGWIFIEN